MKPGSWVVAVVLIVSAKFSYSQRIITGRIPGGLSAKSISYFGPIEQFNKSLFDVKDVPIDRNGRFRIKIRSNESSFINIFLPERMGILSIYEKKNDTVSFFLSTAEINGRRIIERMTFSGDNAEGHQLYQKFRANCNQQFIVDHFFLTRKFDSLDEFMANEQLEIDSIFNEYDILEMRGKIRKDFNRAVKADITGNLFFNIFLVFGEFSRRNGGAGNGLPKPWVPSFLSNKNLYTDSSFKELRKRVYIIYNPQDKDYLTASSVSLFYLKYYYEDMLNGTVASNGASYDTAFAQEDKNRFYGYVNKSILPFMWSVNLYWTPLTTGDTAVLNSRLNKFRQQFPNSPFLPHLASRFSEFYGRQPAADGGEIDVISRPYSTLSELATGEFNNDFVFVDLWATWCTPCVDDFRYKHIVDSLLKKYNIKEVYISLDDTSRYDFWRKFISEKKTYGSHFIANRKFVDSLKEQFTLSEILIPRYLLVDPRGEIINMNLPRPRYAKQLAEAIRKAVQR